MGTIARPKPLCSEEGCPRPCVARSLCGKHYQRWRTAQGDAFQTLVSPHQDATCSVAGCSNLVRARGWCAGHHNRWLRYGDPLGPHIKKSRYKLPPGDRIWSYVKRGAGCWEWQRGITKNGYGHTFFKGDRCLAHRAVWELANGPIPGGMWVLHHCDNRRCCRPDHLFLGDHAANVADAVQKRRHIFGERVPASKLTEMQARAIVAACPLTAEAKKRFATQFGVHVGTIRKVAVGERWKHLQPPSMAQQA